MTNTKSKEAWITCSRCKGTGEVTSRVVYAGMSGGCFKCARKGKVPNRVLQARLDVEAAEREVGERLVALEQMERLAYFDGLRARAAGRPFPAYRTEALARERGHLVHWADKLNALRAKVA